MKWSFAPNFKSQEEKIDAASASLESRVKNVSPYLTPDEAQFASWESLTAIAYAKTVLASWNTYLAAYEALEAQMSADSEEMASISAMSVALQARAALYHAIASATQAVSHRNVDRNVQGLVETDINTIREQAISRDVMRYGLRSADETPLANPAAIHDAIRFLEASRAAERAFKHWSRRVKRRAATIRLS